MFNGENKLNLIYQVEVKLPAESVRSLLWSRFKSSEEEIQEATSAQLDGTDAAQSRDPFQGRPPNLAEKLAKRVLFRLRVSFLYKLWKKPVAEIQHVTGSWTESTDDVVLALLCCCFHYFQYQTDMFVKFVLLVASITFSHLAATFLHDRSHKSWLQVFTWCFRVRF